MYKKFLEFLTIVFVVAMLMLLLPALFEIAILVLIVLVRVYLACLVVSFIMRCAKWLNELLFDHKASTAV